MKHSILEAAAIVIIIVACGLVSLNAFLEFKYKAELLDTPCELCVKLNPEWERCYNIVTTPSTNNKIKINQTNYSAVISAMLQPE